MPFAIVSIMSWFSGINLFGNAPPVLSAEDQAKEWRKQLKTEIRSMDRDIKKLGRAEAGALKECKKLAKKGQHLAARVLAKEIVNTRKATARMYASKAQLNSAEMNLKMNIGMIKVQGCLSKSVEVMAAMNQLVKVPELRETMHNMAKEMEKAGIIDEIISDTMEMVEPDDLELEADAEVSKIMQELTADILTPDTATPNKAPVVAQKDKEKEGTSLEESEEGMTEEEMNGYQERLRNI